MSLNIFPLGDWIASLAGLSRGWSCCLDEGSFEYPDVVEGLEVEADTMLSALEGRLNPEGEARPPPSLGGADGRDDGCWRTAKTKVLLIANLEH